MRERDYQKLVVLKDFRKRVIRRHHDSPAAGHIRKLQNILEASQSLSLGEDAS